MQFMKDIFLVTVFLGLTGLTPITTDCAGAVDYLSPQALVSSENEKLLYIAQGMQSKLRSLIPKVVKL